MPEGVKLGNYEDASQRDIVVMAIPMVIFHLVSYEATQEFRMSVCRQHDCFFSGGGGIRISRLPL